ncbi:MAG: EAL domain-containing protein [Deltaproteobacteria bacterium]|nr:MAG: EAL domain-containing protein [Deltaproteobacteria bacterium]
MLTDITERKAAEERLRHCAMHDALTGLPNRAFFLERLEQVAAHHRRDPGAHFAVLFLDLDRFKILNDSLGHSAGDLLLQELAKRLRRSLRQEDTLARIGGDEFTILLERIKGIRDPVRVAKRIHRALARPFQIEGEEVFTSASIGIALSSSGYREAQELLRNADTAMYRAKERGQGQHVVFDAEMHERALSSLKLESALRQAVERREFRNYYQPIISLESGRIVGFEALLRWPRPKGGMIEPLEFIPVAEETGLMVDICLWSCEEACRQIRAWQKAFPFPLSIHVNISGSNFAQPDFIDRLDRILAKTKLDPTTLKLEITESVIMKNAASLNEMLERIKARKINLHLDDFGTGYSSLSYLHRFPIDALKIDRSFIGALLENAKNLAIVQTILTLARSLDLEVIAEGVETEAQLEEIRRMSCGYAQGYFFARPLAAEDAARLLAAMR